jgi:DegV family protein with EDD domain
MCDIPEDLLHEYGIIVIPQIVIWGEQQLRDRIDLQPKEFYERYATDPVRPISSLPALGDIQSAFQEAIDRGATELVVLTVSSAMSGTYSLVQEAASLLNIPVSMVDAKGPTMSLGWQVLAATRSLGAGADVNTILDRVNKVRERLVQFVAMDSLEYSKEGGASVGRLNGWARS